MAWFQKKAEAGTARAQAGVEKIHTLLNERAVIFPPSSADKAKVLELAAAAACEAHGLGDEGISTTLDTGLSLPHARVDGLAEIAAALAILPQGVKDPKQPGAPVRAMFLFFSPNRQDAFTRHLQVLRGVSTLFQADLLDELCALKTPKAALDLLRSRQP
jgi:mannitol/fructose-specific phosphotransferase system IIA component (Ntr-type)